MDLKPSRLRAGEVVVGLASAVMAVLLFGVSWYGLSGQARATTSSLGVSTTETGWNALPTLRWVILVTIVVGLALAYLQAAQAAPALPVSFSVFVTVLALVCVVGLIYRVLISIPGPGSLLEANAGAYLALACSLVLVYGGVRSMRVECPVADSESTAAVPTVQLGERS